MFKFNDSFIIFNKVIIKIKLHDIILILISPLKLIKKQQKRGVGRKVLYGK